MDGVQIVSVIVAATAAIGAVLSYFKFKPGQREALETSVEQGKVNVAQGTLNIAQGTINLVTAELEDQFKRMSAQVRDLEERLSEQNRVTMTSREDLQKRIDTLCSELRAAQAEKDECERKNNILQVRVQHLEEEVAVLKDGKRESEARAVRADERANRDDARAVRADERADRTDERADRDDARADLAGERAGLSDARATRTEERAEENEARAVRADERADRDEVRRVEEKNGE